MSFYKQRKASPSTRAIRNPAASKRIGSMIKTDIKKSLDISSWRKINAKEMIVFMNSKIKKINPARSSLLIVRSHLRPVDVYAYLRARFGVPNGFQNTLRRDDSDNWVHWDFNLKAHDVDIYIAGTSRDVHFIISEDLADQNWQSLINQLKSDFARTGHAKSKMVRSFEKFIVFQNKFATLADLCAEMHESIIDTPALHNKLPTITDDLSLQQYTLDVEKLSKRATNLYGNCLKLRLLTPIMAEAFINMVILVFCKDEIRKDKERYEAFVRAKLIERLSNLNINCHGFTGPINQKTTVYKNFKRVMDKRNGDYPLEAGTGT